MMLLSKRCCCVELLPVSQSRYSNVSTEPWKELAQKVQAIQAAMHNRTHKKLSLKKSSYSKMCFFLKKSQWKILGT